MEDDIDLTRLAKANGSIDNEFKVVLVGDKGVGKTSLLKRISDNCFLPSYIPTLEADLSTIIYKVIHDKKQKNVKIRLWDTAGDHSFKVVTKIMLQGAKAVLLVYDITNENSWINISGWLENIKQGVENDTIICLVGTKKDLYGMRKVDLENGKEFAENNNLEFIEISSKTNDGIEELLKGLIIKLIKVDVTCTSNKTEPTRLSKKYFEPKKKCC